MMIATPAATRMRGLIDFLVSVPSGLNASRSARVPAATPSARNSWGWCRRAPGACLRPFASGGTINPSKGYQAGKDSSQGEKPMATEKTLRELFHDTLKDIYFAEKKILTALPKMAKAAQSEDLKAAFTKHEGETEQQVDRLEKVFKSIGEAPKGKTCDAIMGILDEGKEIMDEYEDMPALDAGLLAAAQAVEHYEISRYGTLKCWASELGYKDAVKLLDATLKEEKNTDATLTQIAESEVNQHAETAQAA